MINIFLHSFTETGNLDKKNNNDEENLQNLYFIVFVAASAAAQQVPDVSVRLAGDGFFRRGTAAVSSSPSAGFQPRASLPADGGLQASPAASGGGRSGSPSGSSASGATSSGIRFRSGSAIGRQADVGDVDEAVDGVFEPLNLPASASSLLGSISTAFSCDDLPYGYYADRDNACRVYHVCYPALFGDGDSVTYQYR